jgi:hypothetical protein
MRWQTFLALVAAMAGASSASAQTPQPPAPQPQVATTVQLPTVSVFTVQTTVSVPDRGSASLAGNGSGADMSVNRAPIRNRALGSSRAASGVSVAATIHDREEADRALLAEAAAKRGAPFDPSTSKAAALTRSLERTKAGETPVGSVAAIRERNAAAAADRAFQLADHFHKARQAESDGKTAVAKVYYQMVARGDDQQLKEQALARLAALGGQPAKR